MINELDVFGWLIAKRINKAISVDDALWPFGMI